MTEDERVDDSLEPWFSGHVYWRSVTSVLTLIVELTGGRPRLPHRADTRAW